MTTISQRELRNDNAEVVRRVEAGESFVVTRRGTPVADLVPHGSAQRIDVVFTPSTDIMTAFSSQNGPDTGAWLRDIRAVDNDLIDDDRDPWLADA